MDEDLPLAVVDGRPAAPVATTLPINAVARSGVGAEMAAWRAACAAREGAILPLISKTVDPVAYCVERAVCIDTTAAGGNATLLSGSGE